MKKILEILFTVLVTSSSCYSQPYRYVKDIKEIPRGWICVGIAYTQEDIFGGGWKNIAEYQIEDGSKSPKGKQLTTCLLDNLDRTEWNVIETINDCLYCYYRFKQGTDRFLKSGWTIVKVTDAPPQRKSDPNPKPYPDPIVKKPEEKFGKIGFYTDYSNGFNLYVYKVSSKAEKIKVYETGFPKILPSSFNMKENNLVYSNKMDRYFTNGSKPSDFNSNAVLSMVLTEGTYKVIVFDDGYFMKSEKFIEITDGDSKLELIRPNIQMGVPNSEMKKENVEKNVGLTIGKPANESKLKRIITPRTDTKTGKTSYTIVTEEDIFLKEGYTKVVFTKGNTFIHIDKEPINEKGPFIDIFNKEFDVFVPNNNKFKSDDFRMQYQTTDSDDTILFDLKVGSNKIIGHSLFLTCKNIINNSIEIYFKEK